MKSNVSPPVIVALVCIALVLLIGFGWYSMNKEPPLRVDGRNTPMAKSPTSASGTGRQGNSRSTNADPP